MTWGIMVHFPGTDTEVIKKLQSGKAPVDEIRPEMLNVLDEVRLSWLIHLLSIVWESGTVAGDWQTGVVAPF